MSYRKRLPLVDATDTNVQSIKPKHKDPKQEQQQIRPKRVCTLNMIHANNKGVAKLHKKSMDSTSDKENRPAGFILIDRDPVVQKRASRLSHVTDQPKCNNSSNVSELSSVEDTHVQRKKPARTAGLRARVRMKNLQSLINESSNESDKQTSTVKDIYEFTFDDADEEMALNRRRLKQIIDNSTDMDNSMKGVMKSIRLKETKEKIPKKKTSKSRNKRCQTAGIRTGTAKEGRAQRGIRTKPADGDLFDKENKGSNMEGHCADLPVSEIIEKSSNDHVDRNVGHVTTSKGDSKIEITSNVVVSSPAKDIRVSDVSSPWRVCGSSNRRPHTFVVKDKSFVPSYNQDMVMDAGIYSEFTDVEYPKQQQQTNQLDSVDVCEQSSLNNTLFMSPRKVLGELNRVEQSTPKRRSLFGFSSDENEENCDPAIATHGNKHKNKKEKKKERPPRPHRERSTTPTCSVDQESGDGELGLLFQDVHDDELRVKKSTISYEAKRKRKRLLSCKMDDAHIAPDVRSMPTKEQDEEIDRLAAHYNSIFEEIDQHDLCIDGH